MVERLVPAQTRQKHNDVAGFIYAALGVIYAVLIALVVIAVWERFQAANETVEQEANAVAEIVWLGHRFPSQKVPISRNSPVPMLRRWATKSGPLWSRGKHP